MVNGEGEVKREVRGDSEAVYLVRGSVLSLSFVEPHTRDRPKTPDEPAPRDAPRNGFSLQLTTYLPRFPADECEKISRTMHDSKNESRVVLQEIDDTVIPEE